jgi:RNA polymerase sigma factor (sigma-70 family)
VSGSPGPAEPGPPPPARKDTGVKWCVACGAVLPDGAFCEVCGGRLSGLSDYGELYKAYAGPLRRFVRRLAADRGLPESLVDTEGVVHDTFVILLAGAGEPIRNPAAWLFTVARHQVSKAAVAQRRIAPGDPAEHLDDAGAAWATLASPPADAEDVRAAREVMRAIAGLPDHQRIATYLRQVEGWSLAEIGAYLDCATSTAGVHSSRGTSRIRVTVGASGNRVIVAGGDIRNSVKKKDLGLAPLLVTAGAMVAGAIGVVVFGGFAVARALGIPLWLPAVVLAAAAVSLWAAWWLWAKASARRRQRRLNRGPGAGQVPGPPGGTRRP